MSIVLIIVTLGTSQILHSICYFLGVGNEILRSKTKTDIFISHVDRIMKHTCSEINSSKHCCKLIYSKVKVNTAMCTQWSDMWKFGRGERGVLLYLYCTLSINGDER